MNEEAAVNQGRGGAQKMCYILRQPEGQCRQHGLCGHGVVQGPLGAWLSWLRGLQFARGLREGCPGDAASHGRGVCRVPRAVPLTSVSRRREQCGSGTRWAVRSDSLRGSRRPDTQAQP